MSIITLLGLAVGLAMDATAVAISCGTAIRGSKIKSALVVALWFGGFQTGMPLIGFYTGIAVRQWIMSVDHWIGFLILLIIGVRMIYHGVKKSDCNPCPADNAGSAKIISQYTLFLLAIATSLDALAAGFSMSMLNNISIFSSVIIIGVVTFLLSFIGNSMGTLMKTWMRHRAHIIGGVILIAIGLHIVINHI